MLRLRSILSVPDLFALPRTVWLSENSSTHFFPLPHLVTALAAAPICALQDCSVHINIIPLHLYNPLFSYSYALFCKANSANPFAFNIFRTPCRNTRGCTPPPKVRGYLRPNYHLYSILSRVFVSQARHVRRSGFPASHQSPITSHQSPVTLYQPPSTWRIVTCGMVSYDSDGSSAPIPNPSFSGFLTRTIFNTSHQVIGLRYLWLALGSVLLGMLLSLLMRIHLVWPAVQIPFLSGFGDTPERYTALTIFHGSLMVFFVLTTAPQAGFGNYFLPLQIGAREMAFPAMSLISFWTTVASLLGITAAFFVTPNAGLTLWTASVALFCFAALLTAINFTVTTLDLRAKGMTLPRMPLTIWAWFINSILSMLIFSILLAACIFLLSDRLLGSHFLSPLTFLAHQPAPLAQATLLSLWQRLFWFFAQAQVYVAMLPCFGIVSHLISIFSRKQVWMERAAVLALCAVGLFGFCVWGQHMFSSGLNPWSPLVFSQLAASLGLPAFVLVASWFGTLWKGKLQLNTAMLFTLGFVALFLSGGISGIFLSRNDLAAVAGGEQFVTGHFHLVMGVAATFAILAALFFWFPKMFARRMNETLGKLHFGLTLAGVFCVFLPMHWLGLVAHSRMASANDSTVASLSAAIGSAPPGALRTFVTIATIITVAAQILFLLNFVWSLWRGEKVQEQNPWCATTLEWTSPSSETDGIAGTAGLVVYRGAYEFSGFGGEGEFVPQNSASAIRLSKPHPSSQSIGTDAAQH